MGEIRAFISIEFPQEVIKEVARVQNLLKNVKFTGKITELENLHITLKFLGNVDETKLIEVKSRLSKLKFPEFQSSLGDIGTFSYRGMPRIVWIKVRGKVFDLQKEVDKSLKGLFKEEDRFMSHLTIARIKYAKNIKGFYECLKNISIKPIKFKVSEFNIKSSVLGVSGPSYETLETYTLENTLG